MGERNLILLKNERGKKVITQYGQWGAPQFSKDVDNRTEEQKRWWDTYCHRNLANQVLTNIANSKDEEIILLDREETAIGEGMVEFSYVIDLKENTFTVYTHLDEDPLKIYNLSDLPTQDQFIEDLKEYDYNFIDDEE